MEETVSAQVGARMRMIRITAGMKQKELAEKLGVSYQQVQKYETGKDRISVDRLMEVANVLGKPVTDLLEPTDTGFAEEVPAYKRQTLSMMRYFNRIPDEGKRQLLVDIIKHIAGK